MAPAIGLDWRITGKLFMAVISMIGCLSKSSAQQGNIHFAMPIENAIQWDSNHWCKRILRTNNRKEVERNSSLLFPCRNLEKHTIKDCKLEKNLWQRRKDAGIKPKIFGGERPSQWVDSNKAEKKLPIGMLPYRWFETPNRQQIDTPLIFINQMSDDEILHHPMLNFEDGISIVNHKKQFGPLLNMSELIHCNIAIYKLINLKPFFRFDLPIRWQKKQWFHQISASKHTILSGIQYQPNLKYDSSILGSPIGNSIQWRYSNSHTLSTGITLQSDPGEIVLKPDFTSFHLRLSQWKIIESWILGRYTMQLGQGLVQGGLSGFWNAPIVWARKTPDWLLAEKRGFDEFRGYTGSAMALKIGAIKIMAAISSQKISCRINETGAITSLITDGRFTTLLNKERKNNTQLKHFTLASQYENTIKRYSIGMGLSANTYNRTWASNLKWPHKTPLQGGNFSFQAIGSQFVYSEVWFTHYNHHGGMLFGHYALQFLFNQALATQTSSNPNPTKQRNPATSVAGIVGYAMALGKETDISVRCYRIEDGFQPIQGLFNQYTKNLFSTATMISQGNQGKRQFKYGLTIGKEIEYTSSGIRPIIIKHQIQWNEPLGHNFMIRFFWQFSNNKNEGNWDDFVGANHVDETINYSRIGIQQNRTILGNNAQRITFQIQQQGPVGWNFNHKISIIPQRFIGQTSCLFALNCTHRKPFTPLKIGAEILQFTTPIALYYQPMSTENNFTSWVLTGKGSAANLQIEYTLRTHKISGKPTNKTPETLRIKQNSQKIYLSLRTEIVHKAERRNSVQPRIFVSLCWK